MELKITGIVKEVLAEQQGTSANGEWRKREFILTTEGAYPKQICMVQWGDSIDKVALGVGERITASIDIASREYNGRWYTDVKAWKIENEDRQVTHREEAPPITSPETLNHHKEEKVPASLGASEQPEVGDPGDGLPF